MDTGYALELNTTSTVKEWDQQGVCIFLSFWAASLKESNKLIGNVYFQQQEPSEFKTWEVGFVFNPAYYGKGYATEACKRVIKLGFKQLGAHRIIGKCNPKNISS